MVRALLVIFPFPSCQLPQNLSGHHISETSIPLSQMCSKSTHVFENELREEEEDLNTLCRTYSLKTRRITCFLSTVKLGKISIMSVLPKSFLIFGTVPLFEECRSCTNIYNLNQQKHKVFFLVYWQNSFLRCSSFSSALICRTDIFTYLLFTHWACFFFCFSFFFFPSLGMPQFVMPWNTKH